MRALITGASGFVGPYLVRHCTEHGDDVVVPGDELDGFDVVDRAAVHDAFAELRPVVVYHLAAWSHVGGSWGDPTTVLRINVEGTANVLDAARASGVRRVLVVGSAEEYGRVDTTAPIREDAPPRPLTPYGASKVGASALALQAWLGSRLETVRTRSFSHAGPGQAPTFVVPALARRVAEAERDGRDALAVGNLDPVRDLSDVRDVVRAYRLLMERGDPGEVYNVCSGRATTIGEIAAMLVAMSTRRSLRLEVDDALVRPVDVPWLVGDNTKLRTTTGWEPEHLLEETLDAVLEDARAQGS
jgi:GDP-4-dehydro-6-deoxy-D-mannose reductase